LVSFERSISVDKQIEAVKHLNRHKKRIDETLQQKWEDIPILFVAKEKPDWWREPAIKTPRDIGHGGTFIIPIGFEPDHLISYFKENFPMVRQARDTLKQRITLYTFK
jgi:hypothetical protein